MIKFPRDVYAFFGSLRTRSPLVFATLLTWLLLELLFVGVLPSVLGDRVYFASYVPDKAKEATLRFLNNENANIPDEHAGWRNKPNVTLKNWIIDQYGSRSARPLNLKEKSAPMRAAFFGSSMVNGGEGVTNQQTISAGIESDKLEAFNFASMAFAPDQSYLLYQSMADVLQADVVVVGLDADPIDGLYNHYIPLKLHEETGVPYLKPRFELEDGHLEYKPVELAWLYRLDQSEDFVTFLQKNDRFYRNLKQYERCDFTPLAHGLCWLWNKASSVLDYATGKAHASDPLLEQLLVTFDVEVTQRNSTLMLLLFPSERMFHWGGVWKYFPDIYDLRLQALRARGLEVLDVRRLFRDSGKRADDLFADDRHHFSAAGNAIIAQGLLKTIHSKQ